MRANQNTFNIKLILFVIAMISVITVFWVNRLMINQLRSETRQQLEYIAKSNKVRDMIDSSNDEDKSASAVVGPGANNSTTTRPGSHNNTMIFSNSNRGKNNYR